MTSRTSGKIYRVFDDWLDRYKVEVSYRGSFKLGFTATLWGARRRARRLAWELINEYVVERWDA